MSDYREFMRFQLRSVNVPDTLPHKSRAEEIEELPQYVEVLSMIAPGLSLMNIGSEEPGSSRAQFPWIKLNSSGEPLGIYVNVGGTWKPIQSRRFIRSPRVDELVQRGTLTVNMDIAATTFKTFTDNIEFDEEFDDVPTVTLNIIAGSIIDDTTGSRTFIFPREISTKGFGIKILSELNTGTVNKTVTFAWQAVGRKEED